MPIDVIWHTRCVSDVPGFGRDDLDRLAQRAVDTVLLLVRRASSLATGVLIVSVVCCIGGFLLGIAALDGGARSVWVALGGAFAFIGVGAVSVALLRLRSVKRGAANLVAEVRSLIGGDRRSERTVIDTVESVDASGGAAGNGVVAVSRQFFSLKNELGGRIGQFRQLGLALTAVTSFPGLIALATLITFVFAGLSVIFLVALVL